MSKPTAIVIGAGAGGLGVANILAKAGYNVTIYEKNAGPGGRMGLLKAKGFTFDTGPSWYLMDDVFKDYFALFGKKPADYYELTRLDPAYKVFFDYQESITIGGSYTQIRKQFEAAETGAGVKLDEYLGRAEHNYHMALKYFLYNPFRSYRFAAKREVLARTPQFMNMFARTLHGYVGKSFKSLALQQILEYPSVFLGASPFTTPAVYQLMSYLDMKEGVFYPKHDGMYAVTKALAELGKELGVTYTYNRNVESIIVEDGVARGVVVNGKRVEADIVISNADLHFTETKLLNKEHQTYPQAYWQKRQAGPSALLMYLGVKGELPGLTHHNLFFIKDWKQNFAAIYGNKTLPQKASMYVSKTTATDAATAPKGHENLFVLVPLPPGVTMSDKQVEKYADLYLQQLENMSGISDLRDRLVVKELRGPAYFRDSFNAWQNTALGLSHTLRQSAFLRPSVVSKKVKNLYYVGGTTQPGIGVPMCLISAQLMYKELTHDVSPGTIKVIEEVSE